LNSDIELQIHGRSQPFALRGAGPWSLGRSDGCDIAFPDDPQCSRNQAVIRRAGLEFVLEPVSQVTPIKINNQITDKPQRLCGGEVIRFAAQTITVMRREADNRPVPANGRVAVSHHLVVTRIEESRQGGDPLLVLDHPTVSRHHARFHLDRRGASIEDLGSTNGTHVNGNRITRRTPLQAGDTISIGVFTLSFDGQNVRARQEGEGVALLAHAVTKTVRQKGVAQPLTLLDSVNLEIRPGELVCIIGESGSGKSTLMNIVSGRKRPTAGTVRLGELDIHAYFDALKQNIAYVPQSDLLHEVLTLRQALGFVAQLRLPRDLAPDARTAIIAEAARNVGLEQRLDVRIGLLSGGQKKRASLATEILSRPKLLFLDEVTSGLDENTDREIMALLKSLTQNGMTIVCVTHTLANLLEYCDKVIVMARGGVLAFCGAPREVTEFFHIMQLGEVFGALSRSGSWRRQFEQGRSLLRLPPASGPVAARRAQKGSLAQQFATQAHQFSVLTRRNIALLLGDRRTLAMAAMQSMIVGALLGYAYSDFGSSSFEISNSKMSFLLVLGITSLWIGCAGAAKDIVGELAIFVREKDINLSTTAFVLSKFLVTGLFTVLQIAILMAVCALFAQAIPSPAITQFWLAALAAVSGAAVGLFISSISNSRDQAAVIVPLALAPQLILGSGLVTNLSSAGLLVAKLMIGAYWTREAMTAALVSTETVLKINPATGMPVAVTAQTLGHCALALALQTMGWIAVTIAIMLWRHARKAD
jgi:ABC-type multidrug transport system ATPase subunit/pSer/pThr/pTyr-binding forkhead associated (FHA) protein